MTAIFSWLLSWFSDRLPSVIIYVLRVPADDSNPHILPLQTIDASAEGNEDRCSTHIPDMRVFWGRGEGWKWRDIVQSTIIDQNPDINGVYLAWKSFALHLLPLNKNASGCGDVFIAKLKDPECDEHGWTAYEDVSNELLDSGLYKVCWNVLLKITGRLSQILFGRRPTNCPIPLTSHHSSPPLQVLIHLPLCASAS